MGIELIIIGTSIALAAAMSAYAIMSSQKTKQDGMNPASLDSFNITRAQEGLAVPVIYGRVRLPGNIIWYGDLKTEEIERQEPGKGGDGGGSSSSGYRYYLSVWQAICMGEVSLVKTYIDDAEAEIQASDTIWNNGFDDSGYPTNVPKANKLEGVAHIYFEQWYLGDNQTTVPTIHYVLDRVLQSRLPDANLPTGSNPASVILDLLLLAGVDLGQINDVSFIEASEYFTQGLNLVFDQQSPVADAIETVLKYIDAILYVNSDGEYTLKAFDPMVSHVAEISQLEIKDFSLNRKGWGQVPNDFRANFIDESKNFSQRVVIAQNPAAISLAGTKITQSIDLKCFRSIDAASRRLFEIMKRTSYPAAEIKFKTSLRYSNLLPGDIVRIEYSDYGITSGDFRVTAIDAGALNSNEFSINALQVVETLFDDVYAAGGGTSWIDPDNTPIPSDHVAVFELPYTREHGTTPAFIALIARKTFKENAFQVKFSLEETQGYRAVGDFVNFSQYGELSETYPVTRTTDNDTGIIYVPYATDPQFDTISRAETFSTRRLAILGNEIVAFEKVTALSGGRIKLGGVIRGVLNTPIEAHLATDPIWIVYVASNVFEVPNTSEFYVKIIPKIRGRLADETAIDAIFVETAFLAKKPMPVGRIVAQRTGDDIFFQLWPRSSGIDGAGDMPETETDDGPPFQFSGDFEIAYNSTTEIKKEDSFTITLAGAFDLTVRHRENGRVSDDLTVSVGAGDGVYKA